jgi:hypothetical protein
LYALQKGGEESSQDSLYSAILSDAVFFAEAIQGDLDLVFSQFVLLEKRHVHVSRRDSFPS